jgi:predicted nucleotidyltransferase
MTNTARLDLSDEQRRLVLTIFAAIIPADAKLWVFGSRTTGRARRYSDLDLAVDAGRPLTLDERARLAEAFEESDLPYHVDIVDWQTITPDFRRIIAADRIRLN